MNKRIIFTIISLIALILIFAYRVYLLGTDTSGFYSISSLTITPWILFELLPEISIIFTIIGLFLKKISGLVVNIIALIISMFTLFDEGLIVFANFMNYGETLSSAVKPVLTLPVILIAIIGIIFACLEISKENNH